MKEIDIVLPDFKESAANFIRSIENGEIVREYLPNTSADYMEREKHDVSNFMAYLETPLFESMKADMGL